MLYSKLMKVLIKIKLDSIAWSIRRLYCPVDKNALVLEVGSGGNPYFRSNILCDAYIDTRERHFAKLIHDRPTVLAYVEDLPFKDNTFDFVIACHVLEHSKDPEKFLNEIQRVSKAGYIEVPDAFLERLTCYLDHRLEISDINNELVITKKTGYVHDENVRELFLNKVSMVFPQIVRKYPFSFHVRYYWNKNEGGIKYKITNPDYKFNWDSPQIHKEAKKNKINIRSSLTSMFIFLLRQFFSQNKRNRHIDITRYLHCLSCKSDKFEWNMELICLNCGKKYPIIGENIINFTN
ncbi:MAG: hypothetical protein DKM50_04790 [Candidatus Margulisiibacteriota bacterium]|nr:MAG: hypothetical protein DKM50_04790 [Candidatus Margulisiibacteriota bacterium]